MYEKPNFILIFPKRFKNDSNLFSQGEISVKPILTVQGLHENIDTGNRVNKCAKNKLFTVWTKKTSVKIDFGRISSGPFVKINLLKGFPSNRTWNDNRIKRTTLPESELTHFLIYWCKPIMNKIMKKTESNVFKSLIRNTLHPKV